jgi:HEAT repeat protein
VNTKGGKFQAPSTESQINSKQQKAISKRLREGLAVWHLLAVAMFCLAPNAVRAAQPPPEPPETADLWDKELFGSAKNVELLVELLAGDDIRVREQAAGQLGETNNKLALPHLVKAADDPAASVRVAAVGAMAHFPHQADATVIKALADPAREVKFAAMRVAGTCASSEGEIAPAVSKAIITLLDSDDPAVQAEAIHAMTQRHLAVPGKALAGLLGSSSSAVRLRAAQNAALVKGDEVSAVRDEIRRSAASGDAAVRCEALRALGILDYAGGQGELEKSAGDKSPLVRLGVVRGYQAAGQTAKVRVFLDDPSEMVRLAAIRASGDPAGAEAAQRVLELMLQAPLRELRSEDSHAAARECLIAMHSEAMPRLAADAMAEEIRKLAAIGEELKSIIRKYKKPLEPGEVREDFTKVNEAVTYRRDTHQRNIGTCCRILGAYRSTLAMESELNLLKTEPTDSSLLGDVAWSLGRIGNERARAPLEALLAKYVALGREDLRARGVQPPPHIAYNDYSAGEVVEALAMLKDSRAFENILEIATMKDGGGGGHRLYWPVLKAFEAFPLLQTPATARRIDDAFIGVIGDPGEEFDAQRYSLMLFAARQNRTAALPAIRKAMAQRRRQKMIDMAAWAIWKLSGQVPDIPDPMPLQGSDWIVQTRHR